MLSWIYSKKDVVDSIYNDTLNVENSVSTMMAADRYSYTDLRQRALDIVCGGFEKVPATEILKLDHRLMRELLSWDGSKITKKTAGSTCQKCLS